jgi:hypothetical protein
MYGAKGAQPVITLPIKRLGTMIQKLSRGNPGPVQLSAANLHLANLELCQPAQDNTGTSARQVHSRASTCSTKNRHTAHVGFDNALVNSVQSISRLSDGLQGTPDSVKISSARCM